jgi:hypothetical protein
MESSVSETPTSLQEIYVNLAVFVDFFASTKKVGEKSAYHIFFTRFSGGLDAAR